MCLAPVFLPDNLFPVPCGKCIECQMQYSEEWSFRIVQETSLYENNCYVTLTYDDEHLPYSTEEHKRDLQLFMKRLRKKFSSLPIRYFGCGELGEKSLRPHIHIILFNYKPNDMQYFFTTDAGDKIYLSKEIESIWQNGQITVGEVTLRSAKYCAKYLQKNRVNSLFRPFTMMSRKPAIGIGCLTPKMIEQDKIYVNGKFRKLPRAYVSYLERYIPALAHKIKQRRRVHQFEQFCKPLKNSSRFAFQRFLRTGKFENCNYFDQIEYEKFVANKRRKFVRIFGAIY